MLIPEFLHQVEFLKLKLELEADEDATLPPSAWLQLRREFKSTARRLDSRGSKGCLYLPLLEPHIPPDPVLARDWPVPPSRFVLTPPEKTQVKTGDLLAFGLTLWGEGIDDLSPLIELIRAVAERGFYQGFLRSKLKGLVVEDASGEWLDTSFQGNGSLNYLPRQSLLWWLQRQPDLSAAIWSWATPARVIQNTKPLFRATPTELLPLVARRVLGMLQTHCHLDLSRELSALDPCSNNIEWSGRFQWRDWRTLRGESKTMNLGGLSGKAKIGGPGFSEWQWLLHCVQLLHLGKNAAFGSGRPVLLPVEGV